MNSMICGRTRELGWRVVWGREASYVQRSSTVLKSSYPYVALAISESMVPGRGAGPGERAPVATRPGDGSVAGALLAPQGSLVVASESFFSRSVPATNVVACCAAFLA